METNIDQNSVHFKMGKITTLSITNMQQKNNVQISFDFRMGKTATLPITNKQQKNSVEISFDFHIYLFLKGRAQFPAQHGISICWTFDLPSGAFSPSVSLVCVLLT